MAIDLEKIREQFRKDKLIICPFCGKEHDPSDDPDILQGLVTYWGEEDPQEFYCYSCEKTFLVKEQVSRKFIEKKTMKEFNL